MKTKERRELRDRLVRRGYTGAAADRILSLQGIEKEVEKKNGKKWWNRGNYVSSREI